MNFTLSLKVNAALASLSQQGDQGLVEAERLRRNVFSIVAVLWSI